MSMPGGGGDLDGVRRRPGGFGADRVDPPAGGVLGVVAALAQAGGVGQAGGPAGVMRGGVVGVDDGGVAVGGAAGLVCLLYTSRCV